MSVNTIEPGQGNILIKKNEDNSNLAKVAIAAATVGTVADVYANSNKPKYFIEEIDKFEKNTESPETKKVIGAVKKDLENIANKKCGFFETLMGNKRTEAELALKPLSEGHTVNISDKYKAVFDKLATIGLKAGQESSGVFDQTCNFVDDMLRHNKWTFIGMATAIGGIIVKKLFFDNRE